MRPHETKPWEGEPFRVGEREPQTQSAAHPGR